MRNKFVLKGRDKAFKVHPGVIEGLSQNVNLGMNVLLENDLTLDCSNFGKTVSKQKERESFPKVSEARSKPLPLLLNGKLTEETPSHYLSPLEQVWLGMNRWQVLSVLEKGKEGEKGLENIPLYNSLKVEIPPGQGRYLKVQTQHKMRGEMLVESILYVENDINCDIRIPESLYNFQSDNK